MKIIELYGIISDPKAHVIQLVLICGKVIKKKKKTVLKIC